MIVDPLLSLTSQAASRYGASLVATLHGNNSSILLIGWSVMLRARSEDRRVCRFQHGCYLLVHPDVLNNA